MPTHHFSANSNSMHSSRKLVVDIIVAVLFIFTLCTTVLSVFSPNWRIDTNHQRTGLFQQCSRRQRCVIQELNRAMSLLALLTIALLSTSTLASFLLMGSAIGNRNRCYVLVPLTLFGAGATMTLLFMKIQQRIQVNSYCAFIFLVDTVLAYVLGGVTILHGSMFYF